MADKRLSIPTAIPNDLLTYFKMYFFPFNIIGSNDNIITIKTITQLNTGIKINGKVLLVEEEIQINKVD